MPSIQSVDLNSGIRIVGSGVPSFELLVGKFPPAASAQVLKDNLNNFIQSQYETWMHFDLIPEDDPVKNKPKPILVEHCERIEKRSTESSLNRLEWMRNGYCVC